MFNYRVVSDDGGGGGGQLGGLSSLWSSLMMIITRFSVPIYSLLIMAALMSRVGGRVRYVTLKWMLESFANDTYRDENVSEVSALY
jgi:hypothetical protein